MDRTCDRLEERAAPIVPEDKVKAAGKGLRTLLCTF